MINRICIFQSIYQGKSYLIMKIQMRCVARFDLFSWKSWRGFRGKPQRTEWNSTRYDVYFVLKPVKSFRQYLLWFCSLFFLTNRELKKKKTKREEKLLKLAKFYWAENFINLASKSNIDQNHRLLMLSLSSCRFST